MKNDFTDWVAPVSQRGVLDFQAYLGILIGIFLFLFWHLSDLGSNLFGDILRLLMNSEHTSETFLSF